jgi:hypothetical protein
LSFLSELTGFCTEYTYRVPAFFPVVRIGSPATPHPQVGCPSKLVSIRNNQKGNRNLFRHYPKQNVCFSCFASIPKQRVSMFRLNRNKQKTNRKSLIRAYILQFFYRKCMCFSVFSVFFSVFLVFFGFLFRCFGCFASIPKQTVSIDPKQTEDPPKQFKREYIWVLNKPKQTRNRSCFGLFRFEPKIIFVCFEDTLPTRECCSFLLLGGGGRHTRLRGRGWVGQL